MSSRARPRRTTAGYFFFVGSSEDSAAMNASGGTSTEAHERAVQRLVQAGAVPMTWMQTVLEWQRDWARQETYAPVLEVFTQHGGAYGVGIRYAKSILGAHANEGAR